MPTVLFPGHNEKESLAEIMRLFYGCYERIAEHELVAGDKMPEIVSNIREVSSGIEVTTRSAKQTISLTVPAEKFRREIKRQLYCQLEQLTGVKFPWGSLTGVRPTQIVLECCLRHKGHKDAVLAELTDFWRLSQDKALLGIEAAQAEKAVIDQLHTDDLFVYAGVPFCPGRCSYCSFIARDAHRLQQWLEPYVDTMVEEARLVFSEIDRPVQALYLGGGTPTSLPDTAFARLLEGLVKYVPLAAGAEWTVEAGRPDTITRTKLELIRQAGAKRICINPQTMNDDTLMQIGRRHTAAQTVEAFELARKLGFSHINMDLIAGLPGEEPDELIRSLQKLIELEPESITLHTLALKRSSDLQQLEAEHVRTGTRPHENLAASVAKAGEMLRAGGWYPYYLYRQKDVAGGLENTGFARQGKACIYNVAMMSDRFDVIGLGSGAISKKVNGTRIRRSPNSKDLQNYQQRLSELTDRKLKLFSHD